MLQIAAFGSRLEETKALQLHAEEYGFARSFSYEERYVLFDTVCVPDVLFVVVVTHEGC